MNTPNTRESSTDFSLEGLEMGDSVIGQEFIIKPIPEQVNLPGISMFVMDRLTVFQNNPLKSRTESNYNDYFT